MEHLHNRAVGHHKQAIRRAIRRCRERHRARRVPESSACQRHTRPRRRGPAVAAESAGCTGLSRRSCTINRGGVEIRYTKPWLQQRKSKVQGWLHHHSSSAWRCSGALRLFFRRRCASWCVWACMYCITRLWRRDRGFGLGSASNHESTRAWFFIHPVCLSRVQGRWAHRSDAIGLHWLFLSTTLLQGFGSVLWRALLGYTLNPLVGGPRLYTSRGRVLCQNGSHVTTTRTVCQNHTLLLRMVDVWYFNMLQNLTSLQQKSKNTMHVECSLFML